MNNKFNIGDEVKVISNGKTGIIKEVTSYGNNGDIVYIVDIDNKQKAYLESNLVIVRKLNKAYDLDINEMAVSFQIEDKINEIINGLELVVPTTDELALVNAGKLQKYLTTNSGYDELTKKSISYRITNNESYEKLKNAKIDSLINTYIFSEILNKVGNKVLNVVLKDENDAYYTSNLVLIGESYYYFDVTLEQSVFIENGSNLRDFVICCGALGRVSYEQFFKPVSLIDFHGNTVDDTLPNNIARLDIDIDLVNKLIKI